MDTPRTFTRLVAEPTAVATGAQFPTGVKLSAALTATRAAAGETYVLTLASAAQQLLGLNADYAAGAHTLSGTWKVDLRSADLAPFTLGRPLPTFTAAGDGKFTAHAGFAEIRASGRLDATAEQLAGTQARVGGDRCDRIAAEFDLAQRGDATRIERLKADVRGARPIVAVQSLGSFELNSKTGQLKVADPRRNSSRSLCMGSPLAWTAPFLKNIAVSGGDLRGEFALTANNGGIALRSRAPLGVAGLAVAQDGKALVRAVDSALLLAGRLCAGRLAGRYHFAHPAECRSSALQTRS